MAKLIVCVSITLVLLVVLCESSKYDFYNVFRLKWLLKYDIWPLLLLTCS